MKIQGTLCYFDAVADNVGDYFIPDSIIVGLDRKDMPVILNHDNTKVYGSASLECKPETRSIEFTANLTGDNSVPLIESLQKGTKMYPAFHGELLTKHRGAVLSCILHAISLSFGQNADSRVPLVKIVDAGYSS